MFTDKQKKEVWKEILFPLKLEAGLIKFRYRRHSGGKTKQWLVKYDIRSKKFVCYAYVYPTSSKVWGRTSTNNIEREMLKKKVIRAIRRHLKGMEEAKIEKAT